VCVCACCLKQAAATAGKCATGRVRGAAVQRPGTAAAGITRQVGAMFFLSSDEKFLVKTVRSLHLTHCISLKHLTHKPEFQTCKMYAVATDKGRPPWCCRWCCGQVKKAEGKLLQALLPQYTAHLLKHPHSLLARFYGLHRVRSTYPGSRKVCADVH